MKNINSLSVEDLEKMNDKVSAEYAKCKKTEEKLRKNSDKVWDKMVALKGKENRKNKKALRDEYGKIYDEVNRLVERQNSLSSISEDITYLLCNFYHVEYKEKLIED